jgi:hypothetical protein
MKCFGCSVEKDLGVNEVYSYPEDKRLCDEPIPPLMAIECQGELDHSDYRMVVVCHECFRKLDPDMWISEKCWININPVIPFIDLPSMKDEDDMWNPKHYDIFH